ncbi:MAG TPA: YihY/virulence factor BrkB family protein [Acidimicrobiales bacterium]|nr:YihY/virulence factor BrkB family protein [Acidimicrobiales bacterium]
MDRLDHFQRRHWWAGFPLTVLYKCLDDRVTYLAATLTYYALVSLFPLSLVFVSVAGFVLDGHPTLRAQLISTAVHDLPGIGSKLSTSLREFRGSPVALGVGLAGTLYAGLGATTSAQCAFNQIYGIMRQDQPNPIVTRVRGLGLLVLLGMFILATTGLGVLAATANGLSARFGLGVHIAVFGVTFLVDVALFSAAFQLLTARDMRFRDVLGGGVIAAVAWELLQTLGVRYIAHFLSHETALYGAFGAVLAAIAWIYLEALALMIAAEVNVVGERHLWPRALMGQFIDGADFSDGDRACYAMYVEAWRFKHSQQVQVIGPPPRDRSASRESEGAPAAELPRRREAVARPPDR